MRPLYLLRLMERALLKRHCNMSAVLFYDPLLCPLQKHSVDKCTFKERKTYVPLYQVLSFILASGVPLQAAYGGLRKVSPYDEEWSWAVHS